MSAHKELFKELADFCSDNDSPNPKPIDNNALWEALLDVAANETKTLGLYYAVVANYAEKCPEFRDVNPECLQKLIAKAEDTAAPLNERKEAIIPLIVIIPFVNQPTTIKIFSLGVDVVDLIIKEEKGLPMKYLENFEDLMIEDMEPDFVAPFVAHVKELMEGEKAIAATACIAPCSPQIIELLAEEASFIITAAVDGMKKEDALSNQVAVFLLECLSDYFEHDPESAPSADALFDSLVPLIAGENATTAKLAFHAFQAMILAHIFELPVVTRTLASAAKFTSDDAIKYYFKILSSFASPPEHDDGCDCDECHAEPELTIIQPILSYAIDTLKAEASSDLVKGHCLELLGDLAALDQMFVEDCYKEALEVATALIDGKKYIAYGWVSPFFVAMVKCFPEQTKNTIKPRLPVMLDGVTEKTVTPEKKRLDLAADLAEICGSGFCDDLAGKICDIAIELLGSEVQKVRFIACAMCISLRAKMTPEIANKAFKTIAALALPEKQEDDARLYLHTLAKIMKRFTIDDEIVEPVVKAIMDGSFGILGGKRPHELEITEESVFFFLQKYIRKYPTKSVDICKSLVEWAATMPFTAISSILVPINAGLEVFAIKEETAAALAKLAAEQLEKLFLTDVNELIAICETIRHLLDSHPKTVKPINQYFPKLLTIVHAIQEIGEEEDFAFEAVEAMPELARLVFAAYAADADLEVEEDLLGACVTMMPFSPEVEFVGDLLQNLIDMLEDQERFEAIVLPTLKMFTDLLLMKKNELEEFGLDPELVKSMKATLKRICKAKPALGKQITKEFGSSRAKINRFNALIR